MPKWAKFVVAVLLLPLCVGAGLALARVVRVSGSADTVWVAFIAGAACWVVIYVLLPKPMWVYVFGHELTHALWVWLMGGRVKRFKATAKGGHVVVTKTNFLIALAPYFFPLYAVIIILIFLGVQQFWFHLLAGASYAFHLTLTWYVLQTRQSDITDQGYLFSWVVIFLGNIIVLLLGIPLLTARVSVADALSFWMTDTGRVFLWLKTCLA
jgi:hypothetical protein